MLIDPQTAIQIIQPIDLTQIAMALITTGGGALMWWLTGKRVGRGEARMEAVERRTSEHAGLATSAAAVAERHAATAVQVTSMFPRLPVPIVGAGEFGENLPASPWSPSIESLPPEALESEPPTERTVPRPTPPVNRPTPKDPSVRR